MLVIIVPQIIKPKTFHLQCHITERCNLKCKHCYQNNEYIKNELSIEKLFIVVEQYLDALKKWNIINPHFAPLSLTGGEPLVRKDFFLLLEKCYQNRERFIYNIMTNGCLIDRKAAKKIKELETQSVQVSLEGMKKTNDWIRGNGVFDKIMKAIAILKDEGIGVSVSLTAHKQNVKDVPDVINLCKELEVNVLGIRRFVPCGRGSLMKNMILQPLELKNLYDFISRENKKLMIEKTKLKITTGCENSLWTSEEPGFLTHGCSTAYDSFSIVPNGDVFPCRRFPIKVGNITEQSLFNLFNSSKKLQEIRNRNNLTSMCTNCFYFKLCYGGARCVSYGYWGDLSFPDPQCWKLFKKLPKKSGLIKSKEKNQKRLLIERYIQKQSFKA
jgi:radical SAM protein with 4Fe4S-binding SPASM domain